MISTDNCSTDQTGSWSTTAKWPSSTKTTGAPEHVESEHQGIERSNWKPGDLWPSTENRFFSPKRKQGWASAGSVVSSLEVGVIRLEVSLLQAGAATSLEVGVIRLEVSLLEAGAKTSLEVGVIRLEVASFNETLSSAPLKWSDSRCKFWLVHKAQRRRCAYVVAYTEQIEEPCNNFEGENETISLSSSQ